MNQVSRRGTNWHKFLIDDADGQNRSIEFGRAAQLHRDTQVRAAMARRLRLYDAREHLPHGCGERSTARRRLRDRIAAYPGIRPGGKYTAFTETSRNNACGHGDGAGAALNLDNRFRPCNFVELMPRLQEHLKP